MRRTIICALAAAFLVMALSVWAQQQEPEHRDDRFKEDPHAFCYLGEDNGSAHHCTCVMTCGPDINGDPVQQENVACALYCSRQRCTCHAEEPCPGPDPA